MKGTRKISLFWSRLLALLIAFTIIAVFAFGGAQKLMSELSHAYEALAASHYELGMTQNALDSARMQLTAAENALDGAAGEVDRIGRLLEHRNAQLEDANQTISALSQANSVLMHRWRHTLGALAERNRQYAAASHALRESESQLARYLQQPKLSMVVTSERVLKMSERSRAAASQVRLFAEGDGGMLYYEGLEAFHEMESHLYYAERTQVVLTQTGPGDDVLRCFSEGCAMVLAAKSSATQMEAYAYQAQYSSAEMLLVDGRRGRRPGWRR